MCSQKAYLVWVVLSCEQSHCVVGNFSGLLRKGNWSHARTKSLCNRWGGESLQHWVDSGPEMTHQRGEPYWSLLPLERGADSTRTHEPLPGFISPPTAHLCSGKGFQPPTLQGCLLLHLYKHRASCHHVARVVQGCGPGASRFKFPNENDCRPRKQLWSQGPQHSVIQLRLYDFCLVLHNFPQTWNMFRYSLSSSRWSQDLALRETLAAPNGFHSANSMWKSEDIELLTKSQYNIRTVRLQG